VISLFTDVFDSLILSLTFKSDMKFQQTVPYHVIFDLFRSTE